MRGRQLFRGIVFGVFLLAPFSAVATPSGVLWTPATSTCQDAWVPNITYDTYFASGATAGQAAAPIYPIDTGLTMGLFSTDFIQSEIGFDVLLPAQANFMLNAKVGTPEGSLFRGSPGFSFGIYNVGFKKDISNFNILHAEFEKTLPVVNVTLALGVYHGLNRNLMIGSDGEVHRTGWMLAATSPDWELNLKGLKKINLVADAQFGKNAFGAWSFGPGVYFTDNIDLLAGPVFFFDPLVQPGGNKMYWTVQVDVSLPFEK